MTLFQAPPPAFGTATLSNCDREQIHLAASIQPHGALLLASEPEGVILQASANAPEFLGVADLHGSTLRNLGGNLWERIRPHLRGRLETIPVAVRCDLGQSSRTMNVLLHRAPGGGLVVEMENAGPAADFTAPVEGALQMALSASSVQNLCDESARLFKSLTGYDRVMIYRFDEEGHGEVLSETKKPDLEAFLGNRYPASDIPQIARRLYERNRVRVLVDINYAPIPLTPRFSPLTNEDLDMSLCFLRSVSPIHVQYLKNMGVAATLVVSIMVGGRLWGLVSCHHYSPRSLHFEMRAVCELLAEVIATRIAALESFAQSQGELSVRRLEQRMIERISREGDWRGALFDGSRSLLSPLNATGAALLFEDEALVTGDAPGTEEIRRIAKWLEGRRIEGVFATSSLSADEQEFTSLAGVASGVVAVRISGEPGEMLLWFRKERVRTVTWGGNPFKPPSSGDDPSELSPRRSFAQWHQVVEKTSDPWTPADLAAARMIGASVTDVVVQFRSVRILIAQNQLDQVLRQVRSSDQQVIVADAEGRILEMNEAFKAVIGHHGGAPLRLEELAAYFVDREEFARKLRDMRNDKQPWRGEVQLSDAKSGNRPFLVRADAVLSAPDRVLGFVLLFTDLTGRKAAEGARRHFQEGILQSYRRRAGRVKSESDLKFQNLMSNVVENAQLAALEITDGVDVSAMPSMLESLLRSVSRTAEVMDQISFSPEEIAAKSHRPDKS